MIKNHKKRFHQRTVTKICPEPDILLKKISLSVLSGGQSWKHSFQNILLNQLWHFCSAISCLLLVNIYPTISTLFLINHISVFYC